MNRLLSWLVVIAGAFAATTIQAAPVVTVTYPNAYDGTLVWPQFGVGARVSSTAAIQSVTATVETQSAALAATYDGYWGELNIGPLPNGVHILTVAATDVNGSTGSASITITLDHATPQIAITSPAFSGFVARPSIHLVATCTDDDAQGCANLQVTGPWTSQPVVSDNPSRIEMDVVFDRSKGATQTITVQGLDPWGRTAAQSVNVEVEPFPLLRRIADFPGDFGNGNDVGDFDGSRILYRTSDDSFGIYTLGTGAIESISLPAGQATRGDLTPFGALLGKRLTDGSPVLYEWRNGHLAPLPSGYTAGPKQGNFMLFRSPANEIIRRDFVSGTDTIVYTLQGREAPQSGIAADVDAAGAVAYTKETPLGDGTFSRDLYLFDGTISRVVDGSALDSVGPNLDGGQVMYVNCIPDENFRDYTYYFHDGTSASPVARVSSSPGPVYNRWAHRLSEGWLVYLQIEPGSGYEQYWRRAPGSASAAKVGPRSHAMRIVALGPTGEVIYDDQGADTGFFRALPTGYGTGAIPLPDHWNLRPFWSRHHWYFPIGRSLFRLEAPSDELNGDHRSDVLWRNAATGAMEMWFMYANLGDRYVHLPVVGSQWSTATGDFNDDGKADILLRDSTTDQVTLWFMAGGRIIAGQDLPDLPSEWESHPGDFDGDGYSDLLLRNTSTHQVSMWLCVDGRIVGGGDLPSAGPAWEIHVADFNADGKSDILWRNPTLADTTIWFMSGTRIVGGQPLWPVPQPWTLFIGNFNGDPYPDVFWRNSETGQHGLWLLRNGRIVGGANTPDVLPGSTRPYIADFDGDGITDILWHDDNTGMNRVWIMSFNSAVALRSDTALNPMSGWTIGNLIR